MVEQGFPTIYSRMRVMMARMGLNKNLNTGLCPKCAATTTKLENIMVNPTRRKMCTREVLWKNSRLCKILKDFWINGSFTHYRYRKIKNGRPKKDMNFTRLCAKSMWRYIPHVKSTHKTYCTKS